jgi:tetratricopeptide (TPR) repeat protein
MIERVPSKMSNNCPIETQELLVKAFAQVNVVFSMNEIQKDSPLGTILKRFLFPLNSSHSRQLTGIPDRINQLCNQQGISCELKIEPIFHVFPVYQEILDAGFMVPLKITPSDDWQISDAFGTFEYSDFTTNFEAFENFLKRLEAIWNQVNTDSILPLRWRKTFSLSLDVPLHFEAIGGQSLQVPLAIAVLRAFSEKPSTPHSARELPFGNQPVFSTGILNLKTGVFEPVGKVEQKMAAFVREYGDNLPAVLTTEQVNSLKGTPLLKQVSIYKANNLKELMELPSLRDALKGLCAPPLPTEIDRLMGLMFKMQRSIRFGDMKYIIEWLRPDIHSPVYEFQLEQNLGLIAAHRGQFPVAKKHLYVACDLLKANPACFGISDIIDLTTALCTLAIDACAPSLAEPWLRQAETGIAQARASERVKFWGSRCQHYRVTGEYDLAIEAGRQAVEYADMALTGEAGRDRNYLVHALIARARSDFSKKDEDLKEAEHLLHESQNLYAPVEKRESHLGFCLHFEAEIARLQGNGYHPPQKPPWSGEWEHPWMFVLLSSARNQQNPYEDKMRYAEKLILFSGKLLNKYPDSLFELFDAVYRVYYDAMLQHTVESGLKRIEDWCGKMMKNGFPGWLDRLTPYILDIRDNKDHMHSVEALCDAIFYH